MQWLVAVVVGLLLVYLFKLYQSNRHLPPGPVNIFGQVYNKTPNDQKETYWVNLRKTYGDILCIRVLGTPCVYLNSHERIRQFFITHGDSFSGRLLMEDVSHPLTRGRGIAGNEGHSWLEHRRFALSTLRDFGFGKGGTEQIIQSELSQLVQDFETQADQLVDPRLALNMATNNVICSLVFGERCGNEPGFRPIYKMIQQNIEGRFVSRHESTILLAFKVYSKLPASMRPVGIRNFESIYEYLEEKLQSHKKTFNGEIRDLIDAYLKELQNKVPETSTNSTFTEENLYRVILELFVAGTETTASTLRWAIFLMAHHPDIQKRVQAEIDEKLQDRMPNFGDRKQLVYVEAVLMEIQRFATITPLGAVAHRCTEDTQVDQYLFPKNTVVFANLFLAHRDEKIWPEPYKFYPENFYDEATKKTKNADYLIPFGIGRRSCLGESLAKQELFIFFTGILQKFNILPPPGQTLPSEDFGSFCRVRLTPSYSVLMKKRNVD